MKEYLNNMKKFYYKLLTLYWGDTQLKKERILELLLELCQVPSISETKGEIEIAQKIYEIIHRIDYFKNNPHYINIYQIPNDSMNRSYVTAFMEGKKKSNKTVILLSHFDTVGVEEYGNLKELAFNPIEYTEYLKNNPSISLTQETLDDLPELYDLCCQAHGEIFKKEINNFIASFKLEDYRQYSIELIKKIHTFCPYRDPMIILFLAPPYYPHSSYIQDTRVLEICNYVIDIAKKSFNTTLNLEPFFPGLSDMSYLGIIDSIDEEFLKLHFPLWGDKYSIPINTITQLNIPFINIGPLGKDAHKYTERICLSYSLDTASTLIFEAVLKSLRV